MMRNVVIPALTVSVICLGVAPPAGAADPLTGSITDVGHTITWSVTGASAPPADLAAQYDGVVQKGAQVTFSGSATFTLPQGFVTNLSQSGSLTGVTGAAFSQRVYAGTYTLPFSLTTTATSSATTTGVMGSLSARVSSRNCNDYGVCGGPAVTIDLAIMGDSTPPPTTPTPPAGQKQMLAAAYRCMLNHLQEANGYKFSKWTSRGSKDIYRSALLSQVVDVNPAGLRESADAQYLNGVITLRKDPRTLNAADCAAFGRTIWEEVSHAIEDGHGDVGYVDDEDRREARVDYMLEMDETFSMLAQLERDARKGASVAKLRKGWALYAKTVKAAYNKAVRRGYQPDPEELKSWFGWEMSPVQIKKRYLAGQFLPGPDGRNLRKALR